MMILNMKFLPLFATTSLILSIAVSGERQLQGGWEESDTDPCLELPEQSPCTTLEDLVKGLKEIVPRRDDGYLRPQTNTLEDWKGVIGEMLEGDCRNIDLNNYPKLINRYKLYKFTDTKVSSKPKYYCVFAATSTGTNNRAEFPWGTFITRIRQPGEDVRIFNLSIDVPHPLSDSETYEQGVQIYKYSQARSMYLAGAHRMAHSDLSDCGDYDGDQSGYNKADASHNYQNALTTTTLAVKDYWESKSRDFAVIQIHGKGTRDDACDASDVFVADGAANTNGEMQNPNPIVEKFKENLMDEIHQVDFYYVDTFGSNSGCSLGATQNIQARVLNELGGKDDICNFKKDGTGRFIERPNGTFLQIEQSEKVRNDGKLPEFFGNAIRKTFDNPKYYRTSTDQSVTSLAKSNEDDTSSVDDADDVPAATSTNVSGASSFLASVAVVPAAATVVATIAGIIML